MKEQRKAIQAEIITVGSELLGSWRVETNSLLISRYLGDIGVVVARKTVVGDRTDDLEGAFLGALSRAKILILTGGLGPTRDDITREVVSEALQCPLHTNPKLVRQLEERFRRVGASMSKNNLSQTRVPEGAGIIPNTVGTAPGLYWKRESQLIFLLPGPPAELEPMMCGPVSSIIRRQVRTSRIPFRRLRIASDSESRVDSNIEDIYLSYPRIETTILSSNGIIELMFQWKSHPDSSTAQFELGELVRQVRERLGDAVFTQEEENLESVVGGLLRKMGKTLATAESCTGGYIGKMLTDLPGSSDYYQGGIISYSNNLKNRHLNVSQAALDQWGAVSEQVAYQMAEGVRSWSGADLGLSVTGIAGPSGGNTEKPVGLVFLGLSDSLQTWVRKLVLNGTREAIRLRASRMALDWVRRHLT